MTKARLLTLIASIVALAMVVSLVFFIVIQKILRSTYAYALAMSELRACGPCLATLGAPVEPGWLITGEVNLHNDRGEATLTVPVAGPQDDGSLYVIALRDRGEWSLSYLSLTAGGQTQILVQH